MQDSKSCALPLGDTPLFSESVTVPKERSSTATEYKKRRKEMIIRCGREKQNTIVTSTNFDLSSIRNRKSCY